MAKANRRTRAAIATAAKGARPAAAAKYSPTAPHRGRRFTPPPTRTAQPLSRGDLGPAAGVGAVAVAVFASTFSSHVALGDAPETVTGVHSLGILHSPGYVTYVVAARVFGEIVRVGGWPFRVNLFSLVCASLCIAVVYLVARGFGADKIGAAVGAMALATSVSFWFNADFAKYYAFSSLLVVVTVLCVLLWRQRSRTFWLVLAGALTGLSLGVSWELSAIVTVALAGMLLLGPPRPRWGAFALTAAVAVVAAIAVCVWIVIRARQDPTMNWGDATTFHRLTELLSNSDFSGVRQSSGAGVRNFIGTTPDYLAIIGRDAGLGAVLLAFVGMYDVYERRRFDCALFFALLAVGNLVGLGISSGNNTIAGFYIGLIVGGQLVGVYIVIGVLAALGVTRVLYEIEEWQVEAHGNRARSGLASRRLRAAAVTVAVLGAVVPSLFVHYGLANQRMPALSDNYAKRVLSQLPRHSVLLTGGWEYGQPIVERQELYGDRPDVTVVAADNLGFEWYRDELVHRLGLDPSLVKGPSGPPRIKGAGNDARLAFVDALRKTRPVYEDTAAMFSASALFGYEPEGLIAKVVDGVGPHVNPDVDAAAAALRRGEEQDGITGRKYRRFPNIAFVFFYERAHVELAKAYVLAHNLDRAADQITLALTYARPGENRSPITLARHHAANAGNVILGL